MSPLSFAVVAPPRAAPIPPAPRLLEGGAWWRELLGRPGERSALGLAFAWNVLTLAAMYMVLPVRGAFLLANFGPEVIPYVYMASAAATGLAVALYGSFARRSRARLVGGTILALAASLLGWWALGNVASSVPAVAFGFYLWSDVFSIMSVTVFWSYADDVFRGERSKRLFGVIAAAGSLGAILGSLLVNRLVVALGPLPMLLMAAATYSMALPLLWALERWARSRPEAREAPAEPPPSSPVERARRIGEDLRRIASSRLLTLLALLVVLERLVPDFGNYIFLAAAREAFPGRDHLAATLAGYIFWQNMASFAVGLLVASWALRKAGLGWSLASSAAANLAGFALFAFVPTAGVALGFNGVEGVFRYTVFKSAKEATYTYAPQAALYRAKAFIEMFLYRFARGAAGFLLLLLTGAGGMALGSVGVAIAALPLAALWLWTGRSLGAEFKAREDGQRKAAAA